MSTINTTPRAMARAGSRASEMETVSEKVSGLQEDEQSVHEHVAFEKSGEASWQPYVLVSKPSLT